jgi:hypothetical protein
MVNRILIEWDFENRELCFVKFLNQNKPQHEIQVRRQLDEREEAADAGIPARHAVRVLGPRGTRHTQGRPQSSGG